MKAYNDLHVKILLQKLDYKELDLQVHAEDAVYFYDEVKETIIKQVGDTQEELGCGKIVYSTPNSQDNKIEILIPPLTCYVKPQLSNGLHTLHH